VLDADSGDGTEGCKAGVVHQDIHVNMPLHQRLHDLAGTARPAQVSGHDLRLGAMPCGEFFRQLAQFVLAASDQNQFRAVAGVKPGQFPPDPRRGPGNKHLCSLPLPRQVRGSGSLWRRSPAATGHAAPPLISAMASARISRKDLADRQVACARPGGGDRGGLRGGQVECVGLGELAGH